ncbi:MAG TPA: acylphosphatase [Candidatus Binatia bacterium]
MVENSAETGRVHLRIVGRVQGVYFRASAHQEAQKRGLAGWVMNCSDGSVRLIAEGDGIKLEELIAWCHCGPAGAHVTDVEIRWETPEHTFRGFSIRYEGDA